MAAGVACAGGAAGSDEETSVPRGERGGANRDCCQGGAGAPPCRG